MMSRCMLIRRGHYGRRDESAGEVLLLPSRSSRWLLRRLIERQHTYPTTATMAAQRLTPQLLTVRVALHDQGAAAARATYAARASQKSAP